GDGARVSDRGRAVARYGGRARTAAGRGKGERRRVARRGGLGNDVHPPGADGREIRWNRAARHPAPRDGPATLRSYEGGGGAARRTSGGTPGLAALQRAELRPAGGRSRPATGDVSRVRARRELEGVGACVCQIPY